MCIGTYNSKCVDISGEQRSHISVNNDIHQLLQGRSLQVLNFNTDEIDVFWLSERSFSKKTSGWIYLYRLPLEPEMILHISCHEICAQ